MRSTRVLLLLAAIAACEAKPAAPDPWATNTAPSKPPTAPASDPWATGTNAAPTAEPSAPSVATESQSIGLPQGEWRCSFVSSSWMNGTRYTQPIAMNGFTVHGDAFTSKEGNGTFKLDGLYIELQGGGFDGWRGALNVHSDNKPYLVFGGETHRDATPGKGARFGDVQCEPN